MSKRVYVNIMKYFLNLISVVVLLLTPIAAYAKSPITLGKGIWINIWNYPTYPEMFCEQLRAKGIDTIYLQVSRSNTPAIKHPYLLNKIIKSAHARDMKVIGWTYSFLKAPITDAQKFIYAAQYKTPDGDSLDGMAADIEEVTNPKSIEIYSKTIRNALGSKYPLIAITFSPLLKRATPAHYAWKTIANNFDIIAPMTYWHGFVKYRSEQGAYDYTMQTISKLKEYTQKDDIQIHLIGDGQKTTTEEISGFLRAANDSKINAGISLYPWYTPKEHQLDTLGRFQIKQ